MPSFIMSLSHLLSSDFMRCCPCCQHHLKMFQSLCIFLPWPHSTLPPKFLLLQLLACCKSDQGAELVLTSASLFELFCWVFLFFFFPLKWCGSQCCCRKKLCWHNWENNVIRARWGSRGSAARQFISENTTELLSRAAFCCMRHDCWKPDQSGAHPVLTPCNCSSRHC